MDKNRANKILSYSIQVLKGRKIVSLPRGRLHIALLMKEELEESGFWWQAKILDVWIGRALRGDFSERSERIRGAERSGGSC